MTIQNESNIHSNSMNGSDYNNHNNNSNDLVSQTSSDLLSEDSEDDILLDLSPSHTRARADNARTVTTGANATSSATSSAAVTGRHSSPSHKQDDVVMTSEYFHRYLNDVAGSSSEEEEEEQDDDVEHNEDEEYTQSSEQDKIEEYQTYPYDNNNKDLNNIIDDESDNGVIVNVEDDYLDTISEEEEGIDYDDIDQCDHEGHVVAAPTAAADDNNHEDDDDNKNDPIPNLHDETDDHYNDTSLIEFGNEESVENLLEDSFVNNSGMSHGGNNSNGDNEEGDDVLSYDDSTTDLHDSLRYIPTATTTGTSGTIGNATKNRNIESTSKSYPYSQHEREHESKHEMTSPPATKSFLTKRKTRDFEINPIGDIVPATTTTHANSSNLHDNITPTTTAFPTTTTTKNNEVMKKYQNDDDDDDNNKRDYSYQQCYGHDISLDNELMKSSSKSTNATNTGATAIIGGTNDDKSFSNYPTDIQAMMDKYENGKKIIMNSSTTSAEAQQIVQQQQEASKSHIPHLNKNVKLVPLSTTSALDHVIANGSLSTSGGDKNINTIIDPPTIPNSSSKGWHNFGANASSAQNNMKISSVPKSSRLTSPFSPKARRLRTSSSTISGASNNTNNIQMNATLATNNSSNIKWSMIPSRKVSILVNIAPNFNLPVSSLDEESSLCLYPNLAQQQQLFSQNFLSSSGTNNGNHADDSMSLSTFTSNLQNTANSPARSIKSSYSVTSQTSIFHKAPTQPSQEIILVNPKAFGQVIPTSITLETAKLVASLKNIHSEDWVRKYKFDEVCWPQIQQLIGITKNNTNDTIRDIGNAIVEDVKEGRGGRCVFGYGMKNSGRIESMFGFIAGNNGDATPSSNGSVSEIDANSPDHKHDVPMKDESSTEAIGNNLGLLGFITSSLMGSNDRSIPGVENGSIHEDGDQEMKQKKFTLSMIEIAGEDVLKDLLVASKTPMSSPSRRNVGFGRSSPSKSIKSSSRHSNSEKTLKIRHPDTKGAIVENAVEAKVENMIDLKNLVKHALHSKSAIKSRRINGGRGHIIATLKVYIPQVKEENQAKISAFYRSKEEDNFVLVQLIDLACADTDQMDQPFSMGRTKVEMRRIQERRTTSIRKSMSSLRGVLRGLIVNEAQKTNSNISYRECTLTKLVQRTLDYQASRAVVMATVCPRQNSYEKTLHTLNYMNRLLVKPTRTAESPFETRNKENESFASPTFGGQLRSPSDNHSVNSYASSAASEALQTEFVSADADAKKEFLKSLVTDPRQRLATLLTKSPGKNASNVTSEMPLKEITTIKEIDNDVSGDRENFHVALKDIDRLESEKNISYDLDHDISFESSVVDGSYDKGDDFSNDEEIKDDGNGIIEDVLKTNIDQETGPSKNFDHVLKQLDELESNMLERQFDAEEVESDGESLGLGEIESRNNRVDEIRGTEGIYLEQKQALISPNIGSSQEEDYQRTSSHFQNQEEDDLADLSVTLSEGMDNHGIIIIDESESKGSTLFHVQSVEKAHTLSQKDKNVAELNIALSEGMDNHGMITIDESESESQGATLVQVQSIGNAHTSTLKDTLDTLQGERIEDTVSAKNPDLNQKAQIEDISREVRHENYQRRNSSVKDLEGSDKLSPNLSLVEKAKALIRDSSALREYAPYYDDCKPNVKTSLENYKQQLEDSLRSMNSLEKGKKVNIEAKADASPRLKMQGGERLSKLFDDEMPSDLAYANSIGDSESDHSDEIETLDESLNISAHENVHTDSLNKKLRDLDKSIQSFIESTNEPELINDLTADKLQLDRSESSHIEKKVSRLTAQTEALQSYVNSTQKQLNRSRAIEREKQQVISELNHRIETTQEEIQSLKFSSNLTIDQIKRDHIEALETEKKNAIRITGEAARLMKQELDDERISREHMKEMHSREISMLKAKLDRSEKLNKELSHKFQDFEKELISTHGRHVTDNQRLDQLSQLENELTEQRRSTSSLRRTLEEMNEAQKNLNDELELMRRDNMELQQKLDMQANKAADATEILENEILMLKTIRDEKIDLTSQISSSLDDKSNQLETIKLKATSLEKSLNVCCDEKRHLEESLSELRTEHSSLGKQVVENEEKYNDTIQKLSKQSEEAITDSEKQKKELMKELDICERERNMLKSNLAKEVQRRLNSDKNAEHHSQLMQDALDDCKEQKAEVMNALKTCRNELINMEADLFNEKANKRELESLLNNKIQSLVESLNSCESENSSLCQRLDETTVQKSQAVDKLSSYSQKVEELEQSLSSVKKELKRCEKQKSSLNEVVNSTNDDKAELNKKLLSEIKRRNEAELELERKASLLAETLSKHDDEKSELVQLLNAANEEIKEKSDIILLGTETTNLLERRCNEQQESYDKLKNTYETLRLNLEETKSDLEKACQTCAELKETHLREIDKYNKDLHNQIDEKNKLQAGLADTQKLLDDVKASLDKERLGRNEDMMANLQKLQTVEDDASEQRQVMTNKMSDLNNCVQEYQKKYEEECYKRKLMEDEYVCNLASLQTSEQTKSKKIAELEIALSSSKNEVAESQKRHETELQNYINETDEQIATLKLNIDENTSIVDSQNEEICSLQDEIKRLYQSLKQEIEGKIRSEKDHGEEVKSLEETIVSLQGEKQLLSKGLSSLEEKLDSVKEQMLSDRNTHIQLANENNILKDKVSLHETNIINLRKEVVHMRDKNSALSDLIQVEKQLRSDCETKLRRDGENHKKEIARFDQLKSEQEKYFLSQLQTKEDNILNLNAQYKETFQKYEGQMHQIKKSSTREIEELQTEIVTLKQNAENQIERLRKDIETVEGNLGSRIERNNLLEEEIEKMKLEHRQVQRSMKLDLEHAKQLNSDLRQQLSIKQRELDSKTHDHQHYKESIIQEANEKYENLSVRFCDLQIVNETLSEQNEQLLRKCQESKSRLMETEEKKNRIYQSLKENEATVRNEMKEIQSAMEQTMTKKSEELARERKASASTINKLEATIKELEFRLNAQEEIELRDENKRLTNLITKLKEQLKERERFEYNNFDSNLDLSSHGGTNYVVLWKSEKEQRIKAEEFAAAMAARAKAGFEERDERIINLRMQISSLVAGREHHFEQITSKPLQLTKDMPNDVVTFRGIDNTF